MHSAYMCYYEHLAKLSRVANKQTLFLAHLLYRMEWNSDAKQCIVSLTAYDKRTIIEAIGCDSKDPGQLARQYLARLCKSGLIRSIGGSAYLIDPQSYSGSKYVSKKLRIKNSTIYETRVFMEDKEGEPSAYIITEEGERIDLHD